MDPVISKAWDAFVSARAAQGDPPLNDDNSLPVALAGKQYYFEVLPDAEGDIDCNVFCIGVQTEADEDLDLEAEQLLFSLDGNEITVSDGGGPVANAKPGWDSVVGVLLDQVHNTVTFFINGMKHTDSIPLPSDFVSADLFPVVETDCGAPRFNAETAMWKPPAPNQGFPWDSGDKVEQEEVDSGAVSSSTEPADAAPAVEENGKLEEAKEEVANAEQKLQEEVVDSDSSTPKISRTPAKKVDANLDKATPKFGTSPPDAPPAATIAEGGKNAFYSPDKVHAQQDEFHSPEEEIEDAVSRYGSDSNATPKGGSLYGDEPPQPKSNPGPKLNWRPAPRKMAPPIPQIAPPSPTIGLNDRPKIIRPYRKRNDGSGSPGLNDDDIDFDEPKPTYGYAAVYGSAQNDQMSNKRSADSDGSTEFKRMRTGSGNLMNFRQRGPASRMNSGQESGLSGLNFDSIDKDELRICYAMCFPETKFNPSKPGDMDASARQMMQILQKLRDGHSHRTALLGLNRDVAKFREKVVPGTENSKKG